jgi:hypothetical protein
MSILKCNRLENTSTASGGLDVDTSGKVRITTLADSSGNNNSTPAEIASGRAKAWANFNGTGTVAIKGSYNVSSITDNGTGDYTINFTNAMANANYAYTYGLTYYITTMESVIQVKDGTVATTGFTVLTGFSYTSPGSYDVPSVAIAVFGD